MKNSEKTDEIRHTKYDRQKYYDKKFKEHQEMVECGCWLTLALILVAIVFGMAELISYLRFTP